MEPGTRVRLKADPSSVGIITGKKQNIGEDVHWQVDFLNKKKYCIEGHLENIPDNDTEHPIDLFRQGKFGKASDLRGNLTHKRLSGRLANLIYSMDTTHTEFYPYQFKPLLKFLNSPSNGLLIADEVGLGKTIEAGLIWTELRSRFNIRRVMVMCLATLREKWCAELSRRFGIKGTISGASEVLSAFQNYRSGEELEYTMICSMQGLRPRTKWRDEEVQDPGSMLARFLDQAQSEEPLLDLLIIDEAHYLRNPSSMTSKIGRLLRSVSDYIVLLSATPIHLQNEDLYQLLNMVDENTFNLSNKGIFDEMIAANAPLLKLRDEVLTSNLDQEYFLEKLENISKHRFFENNRQIMSFMINPPTAGELKDIELRVSIANRLDNMNLLGSVINRTRKKEAIESPVKRKVTPEMIPMSKPERKFYEKATELIREFAITKGGYEAFFLAMTQRQITSSMPAAIRGWIYNDYEASDSIFEDIGILSLDRENENLGDLKRELIAKASQLGDYKELYNNDTKYIRLLENLKEYFKKHIDSEPQKVVLFSYFRGTIKYLQERLNRDGIETVVLMGGVENKQSIIDEFRSLEKSCVLLSTEVASEGVDLQFCKLLINFDLPWNPMRVEQRIGRLDRIGQKSPVITIWNIFYQDTIDSRIFFKLFMRLQIFESALGCLEPILGDQIRKLTKELLLSELTPEEQEERIEKVELALASQKKDEEKLEAEAGILMAHENYIINKIRSMRELHRSIDREDILNYVTDFLLYKYPGSEIQQVADDPFLFDIKLSDNAKLDFEQFLMDNKLIGRTRLHKNFYRPVKCRFENRVDDTKFGHIEKISQFHPLVKFINNTIENDADYEHYSPVCVRLNKKYVDSFSEGIYVFHIAQWSISGMRDIERLYVSAHELNGQKNISDEQAEKLVTIAAQHGDNWQGVENVVDLEKAACLVEHCLQKALNEYEKYVDQVKIKNDDRADIQEKSLKEHQEREIEKLREQYRRQEDNPKIARMKLGKIHALEGRLRQKILKIQERRTIHSQTEDLCIGLIKIQKYSEGE